MIKIIKQNKLSLAITLAISPIIANAQFSPVVDFNALTPQTGVVINGDTNNKIASSLASIADFNGDGIDDIIVNSKHGTSTEGDEYYYWDIYKGGAYIVFGGDHTNGLIELPQIDSNKGFNIKDNNFTLNYLKNVASAGDINGDGFDDIILSSPGDTYHDDTGSTLRIGGVYILLGRSNNIPTIAEMHSIETNYHRNTSADSIGDVNGDGFDDVLICSSLYNYEDYGNYKRKTSASIIFGSANGSYNKTQITGFNSASYSCSTGGKGDINGDGINDIILSEKNRTSGVQQNNGAYIIYGKSNEPFSDIDINSLDGTNGFIVTNPSPSSLFPQNVDMVGDVNNDGVSDFAFAVNNSVYVVFGSANGFPTPFDVSTLNGTNGFIFSTGIKVQSAGDVNNDNINDILINYYSKTYVIFGKPSQFANTMNPTDLNGSNGFRIDSDNNSISVSSAGDFNADGIDDILVGSPTSGLDNSGKAFVLFGKQQVDLIFNNSFEQ